MTPRSTGPMRCVVSLVTYLVVAADLASPLEEFPTTVSHLGKRPQPDPAGENLVENDVGPSLIQVGGQISVGQMNQSGADGALE